MDNEVLPLQLTDAIRGESLDFWYKKNECENPVQAPCLWSNLFISYILSEHFFSLFRKTSLYLEKMKSKFRK